jgi:hypothetical protein
MSAVVLFTAVVPACFTEGDIDPNDGGGGPSDGGTSTTTAGSSPTTVITEVTSSPDTTGASSTADATSSAATSSSGDETGAAFDFCTSVAAELEEPLIACTSFDGPNGDVGTWTESTEMGGEIEIVDDRAAPSLPSALQVSFDAGTGEGAYAHLFHQASDTLLLTRLRFRMERGACEGPTPLAQLSFDGDVPFAATLNTMGESWELAIVDATNMTTVYPLDAELIAAAGPWPEWEIRVDVDSAYVDVLLNGDFLAQITDLATPEGVPEPPTVRLGIARKSDRFACLAQFDDVVVY